jgi:hypothetical protein
VKEQSNIPILSHRSKSKWLLSKDGGPSWQALPVKIATKQGYDLFGQETSPPQFKDNRPLKECFGKYPDPEVIPSQFANRQTFIMLHGRGFTAETYAPPLLAQTTKSNETIQRTWNLRRKSPS